MCSDINYHNWFHAPVIKRRSGCPFAYYEMCCPNCGGIHDFSFPTYEEMIAAHNTVYMRKTILQHLKNIMKKRRKIKKWVVREK